MKSVFHQRLDELQDGLSNAAFARKLGIPPTTFQGYKEGSLPRIDAAISIAEACRVSVEWLIGEGSNKLPKARRDLTTVSLPRYDIQASAGHGALAHNQAVADYLTVSRNWLSRYVSKGAEVVVIEARGDSMEPSVNHGDLLLVEMNIDVETLAAGGVFVITISGMIMIKRIQIMLNGDLKILSDNKAYEAETIPAGERDERVIVHGRVFWSGGPLSGRR